MAKKKKPKPSRPASAPVASARPTDEGFEIAEVWRHPTLMLAAIAVAPALLSAWAAVHFCGGMAKGAVREATGVILGGPVGARLFASCGRGRGPGAAQTLSGMFSTPMLLLCV